ncbi:MAG: hypothetical protein ACOZB3_13080 [Calditrichota bacterium]
MKRHLIFFVISFIAIGAVTFGTLSVLCRNRSATEPGGEIHRLMVREARLIEHFCLSRIPPTTNRAAIPAEWEKALGTTIDLRETAGEVSAIIPEVKPNAAALRVLVPGQSVFIITSDKSGRYYALIYRPTTSAQQYLALRKLVGDETVRTSTSLPMSPWLISILIGGGCAVILTLIAGYLSRQTA